MLAIVAGFIGLKDTAKVDIQCMTHYIRTDQLSPPTRFSFQHLAADVNSMTF